MSDPNACKPCISGQHDACASPRMCLCDHKRDGCYLCQPNNPNAAEESCVTCEHEHWNRVSASIPSVEARRRSLARMLRDQPRVKIGLTGGQKRALRRAQCDQIAEAGA